MSRSGRCLPEPFIVVYTQVTWIFHLCVETGGHQVDVEFFVVAVALGIELVAQPAVEVIEVLGHVFVEVLLDGLLALVVEYYLLK